MADRYFINGGVNSNWDTSGNWSATDGGAASGVKPSASDAVFFTALSPNCTVNTAGVGNTINFTGYTNTITMTAGLTISGSITLVAGMTIAGASGLTMIVTGTLTSGGKTWPNAFSIGGAASITATLADNWDVNGLFTFVTGTQAVILNGNQINCGAGLTKGGSGLASGTTNIIMDGTGTITLNTTTALSNNLTINTAGTITLAATTGIYGNGTLTYTAGTVTTAGSTITIGGVVSGTTVLACSGITFNNIIFSGATSTVTLNENVNVSGLPSIGSTTNVVTINGNTINCAAGLRYAGTSGVCLGTTVLKLTGTGTFDAPSATSGGLDNTIELAAGAGTVTIGSTATRIRLDKVLFTSGTITTTPGTWASGGGGGNLNQWIGG